MLYDIYKTYFHLNLNAMLNELGYNENMRI